MKRLSRFPRRYRPRESSTLREGGCLLRCSAMADEHEAATAPSSSATTSAAAAATMLSAVMRRRIARKKLIHDQNFQTWNRLDEMKESMAVRSIRKFRGVFVRSKKDGQVFDVPSSEIPVEIEYEGLHIKVRRDPRTCTFCRRLSNQPPTPP